MNEFRLVDRDIELLRAARSDPDAFGDFYRRPPVRASAMSRLAVWPQCLSSLSLDFERFEPGDPKGSPDMQVQSVSIDGAPLAFPSDSRARLG